MFQAQPASTTLYAGWRSALPRTRREDRREEGETSGKGWKVGWS